MRDPKLASFGRRNLVLYGAYLGCGLAIVALALLAASPLGWHAGWWHFRFAFFWLMPFSAYIALAGVIVSALALVLKPSALGRRGIVIAGVGVLLGAALTYVPWQYRHTLNTLPRIHDITTDTENPPIFVASLQAREAEKANPVNYEGPELAKQQKAAYPDIAPVNVDVPPAQAFERALDAAKAMSGWIIVDANPAAGRIEAHDTSLWFRFVDDIVIRVAANGSGSRIDIRSVSRQGRSDFGVNARRIRVYEATLKARLA